MDSGRDGANRRIRTPGERGGEGEERDGQGALIEEESGRRGV